MSYEEDVQQYMTQNQTVDSRESEAMRKIFVGGLNRETSTEAFTDYFGQFGETEDTVIIKDPATQGSRGFGFITYKKADYVEAALKGRPHIIDNKTVDIKRAMPREFNTAGAHAKTTRLYVGGFKGMDFTPDNLREYIESRHPTNFGRMVDIDFLKDPSSDSYKGFGFVECSDSDFADRLAISEDKFTINSRTLSIKKAEPRAERGGSERGGRGGGGGPMRGRGGSSGFRGGREGFNGTSRGGSRGGRGGGRGSFGQGGGGGGYNQGGGYSQGYNQGGSYNQSSNYNNQSSGYSQGDQGAGGYNQSGGYNQGSGYNQSGGYNQGQGGYNQGQGGYNQGQGGYNQSGGYNQGQGVGSYGQSSGGYQQGGQDNRYKPY